MTARFDSSSTARATEVNQTSGLPHWRSRGSSPSARQSKALMCRDFAGFRVTGNRQLAISKP